MTPEENFEDIMKQLVENIGPDTEKLRNCFFEIYRLGVLQGFSSAHDMDQYKKNLIFLSKENKC